MSSQADNPHGWDGGGLWAVGSQAPARPSLGGGTACIPAPSRRDGAGRVGALQAPERWGLPFLVLSHWSFWRQVGAAGLSRGFAAVPEGRVPRSRSPALRDPTAAEPPVAYPWGGWFPPAPTAPQLPGTEERRGLPPTVRMVQISMVDDTRNNNSVSSSLNFPEQNSPSERSRHFAIKKQ